MTVLVERARILRHVAHCDRSLLRLENWSPLPSGTMIHYFGQLQYHTSRFGYTSRSLQIEKVRISACGQVVNDFRRTRFMSMDLPPCARCLPKYRSHENALYFNHYGDLDE